MSDRLSVDTTGIKLALLVGGGLLLFIFAGQVLRFMSRMVAWGSFVLLAALAMYVAYEVYTGWTAGSESQRSVETSRSKPADPVSDVKTEYAEGSMSEAELEEELDQLLDDQRERERRDMSELEKEL
ncbi:hypothetical protein ACFQH2_06125 [Natronoarchaeum sp. GCM10025703]|uniref:hypothetical protein n=1 Tax=unclassified Natronoarchaeum TaxID=2620183 RepID=UPI00361F2D5A